ncbi:MAG: polyhydroxybutyrate depolymerase [Pseudomonadota bacterium]
MIRPLTKPLTTAAIALAMLAAPGLVPAAKADEACGVGEPCVIEGGEYYLVLPDDWDSETPLPALMFFHGHASSGESVITSQNLKNSFGGAGYAIIAPNGAIWPERDIRAWPARLMTEPWRDDVAFSLAVLEDVATKIPLDQDRILVSGFSAGGSMAWMMACHEGARFQGFAPVAGALRRPVPDEGCSGGPAPLIHIHGFTDRQVPLEGRAIRDWHQGDVFESLELMRTANQCASLPSEIAFGDNFRCRYWNDCASESPIAMCMHDGGHGLPEGWAGEAIKWFESLEAKS